MNKKCPEGSMFIALTKREHFAGLAMQGLLADSEVDMCAADVARACIEQADALLAELKTPTQAKDVVIRKDGSFIVSSGGEYYSYASDGTYICTLNKGE